MDSNEVCNSRCSEVAASIWSSASLAAWAALGFRRGGGAFRRETFLRGALGISTGGGGTRTAGGGTGDPPATAPGEGWERTAAIRRTASHCLEALHLEVASRSPRVWGRRKIYEVYCMPRPVRTVGRGDGALKSVRDAVEREFRSSFHGGGEDQSGVRVYVLLRRVVPKLWGKEAKGSRRSGVRGGALGGMRGVGLTKAQYHAQLARVPGSSPRDASA